MVRAMFLVYNDDRNGPRFSEEFLDNPITLPEKGDLYTHNEITYVVSAISERDEEKIVKIKRLKF